jgi:two-component system sensor histidine kinase/response regulator
MAGDLNEKQKEALDVIEKGAYEMFKMIKLSLDLYKMETGKYQFESVPVNILE